MNDVEFEKPKFKIGQIVFFREGCFKPEVIDNIRLYINEAESIFYYGLKSGTNNNTQEELCSSREEALQYKIKNILDMYSESIEKEREEISL